MPYGTNNSLLTRANLQSSGRQARQAPTSCDEIAELVTALEEAESAIDRLALVFRILSTTITKCTTSDNLLKVVLHFLLNNFFKQIFPGESKDPNCEDQK